MVWERENVQSGGLEHNLPPGLTSWYHQSRLLSCHCPSVLEESEGKASGKRICKRERQQTSFGVKHRADQHHAKHREERPKHHGNSHYPVAQETRDTIQYGTTVQYRVLGSSIGFKFTPESHWDVQFSICFAVRYPAKNPS